MQQTSGWLGSHRKALILFGLTAVAYLAAINRNQAFPWAVGALLSATLVAGFVWPRWLISRLSVTRSGPHRAEEGEVIEFRVVVENRGWMPRFMVELVDRLPFVGLSAETPQTSEKVLGLLVYLPGLRSSEFAVPVLCEKRGYYRLGPVGLATSFPLGLLDARMSANGGVQTLTIYPDVFNIQSLPLRGAPSQIHRGGYLLPEGAGAAEFAGLRDYRRGDNPRHIHWPTTARLNELIVREYEPLASACLYVVLDQYRPANGGVGKESTFEYAVRIAASIARYGCLQNIRTRVAGEGAQPLRIASGMGDLHNQEILDRLAVIDCDGGLPYGALLRQLAPNCIPGETVVVFLADDDPLVDDTVHALALLNQRRVHLLAVVFDRQSFRNDKVTLRAPSAAGSKLVGALLEFGAQIVPVARGEDLVRRFNQ